MSFEIFMLHTSSKLSQNNYISRYQRLAHEMIQIQNKFQTIQEKGGVNRELNFSPKNLHFGLKEGWKGD